ncbi:MAG: 5,10-methylenetetrahydrofolate reductase [Dehalococcoidales bacterium]|nr:5,10-methylenetetrahydrofolate reductase [Dehalococcoidales bacterium]
MIVSELKPMPEILACLGQDKDVFLIGCHGCAEACQTGGEPQVLEMKQKLEEAGKRVTGHTMVDMLCNKALVKMTLYPHEADITAADSALVMTCGIGVQATAAVVDKPTHPACNTVNLGGSRGEWRGSERCRECGDCLLDYTGGICPLTACTKSLINGPCGGAKDGKCEFEPTVRDCGWHLIYLRLQKTAQLDKMKTILPPKDNAKMQPPPALRSTIIWALEQKEIGR